MKNKTKIVSICLIFLTIISFSGCGCKKQTNVSYQMDLEIWGIFDDRDDYREIFDAYQKANPQIEQITYRKLLPTTYKEDLLEALAAGKGPDIFLIHNAWLPSFENKLVSAPSEMVSKQIVGKEFVDVVSDNFILNNNVYALPLSVDSMALFYNKDLLNRAGITNPPVDWEEFREDVSKMTEVDQFGNINQSGVSMGTAYNINRSTDILSLLFFQNKIRINDERDPYSVSVSGAQGENALKFYSQFSDSGSPFYSWNSRMHYSLDAFAEGNLAMMLNYSWQIEELRRKSPKLNFGVVAVPQLDPNEKVTYANYWGYGVAKNKIISLQDSSKGRLPSQNERVGEAWKFIRFLTLKKEKDAFDPAASYLEKTKKPAARRDLIEKQRDDIDLGVFALSNLYAKSFIQYDPERTEIIMAEAIDRLVKGESSYRDTLISIQNKINKLAP